MLKRIFSAAIAAALLFSLSACGSSVAASTAGSKAAALPKKLVIAQLPSTTQIVIGKEKGFFEDEFKKDGIAVEFQVFNSGPEIIEAFKAGTVDFGISAAMPIINAKAAGGDLKVIGTYKTTEQGNALVARNDRGIKTVADLKGKNVGYAAGTTVHLLALKMLEGAGLKETDVNLVNLKVPDQITALKEGTLDAGFIWEPQITQLLNGGGYTVIKDGTDLYTEVCGFLVKESFIKEHRNLVESFLKANQKSEEWIQSNRDEAISIIAKASGQDKADIKAILEKSDTSIFINDAKVKGFEDTAKYLFETKVADRLVTTGDILDLTIQESAGIPKK